MIDAERKKDEINTATLPEVNMNGTETLTEVNTNGTEMIPEVDMNSTEMIPEIDTISTVTLPEVVTNPLTVTTPEDVMAPDAEVLNQGKISGTSAVIGLETQTFATTIHHETGIDETRLQADTQKGDA